MSKHIDSPNREKIMGTIEKVAYNGGLSEHVSGETRRLHEGKIADQVIALITEGLKKQIDIKREYAFAESLFGSLEHQERMQAMVDAYDVVRNIIKNMEGNNDITK